MKLQTRALCTLLLRTAVMYTHTYAPGCWQWDPFIPQPLQSYQPQAALGATCLLRGPCQLPAGRQRAASGHRCRALVADPADRLQDGVSLLLAGFDSPVCVTALCQQLLHLRARCRSPRYKQTLTRSAREGPAVRVQRSTQGASACVTHA